ncbi:MAG: nuclear transport factor 2 family protein [Bacteroidota bacterium]
MKVLRKSFPIIQDFSKLCLSLMLLGWGSGLLAQESTKAITEEARVEAAVNRMFEGMYKGDSAMVHSVMGEDVRFETTTFNKEGDPVLFQGSLESFLEAVGTPHDAIWDERISNLKVMIDDNLAIAWMDYSFYVGENFSHCGVNAMSLFRSPDGWEIIYIIDTRRKENCK